MKCNFFGSGSAVARMSDKQLTNLSNLSNQASLVLDERKTSRRLAQLVQAFDEETFQFPFQNHPVLFAPVNVTLFDQLQAKASTPRVIR